MPLDDGRPPRNIRLASPQKQFLREVTFSTIIFNGWHFEQRAQKNPGRRRGFWIFHLSSFNLDLLLGLDGLRLLGKPHREHAILETCFDLVGVDALR